MSEVPPPAPKQKRNKPEVSVLIEGLDKDGRGQGRLGERQIFIRRALPGQQVRAAVISRRRGVLEGRLLEVLTPSPDEGAAACAHVQFCGGCAFQELTLSAQHRHLWQALQEVMRANGFLMDPAAVRLGGEPWHYRNKMEFSFGARRFITSDEDAAGDLHFALGLHARGLWDKVLDLDHCKIAFAEATPLLASVRRLSKELDLKPYDARSHEGFLRHLVLRKAFATGQISLELVTAGEGDERLTRLFRALQVEHPELTTALHAINDKPADTAIAESRRVVFGPGVLIEKLRGLEFEISPGSFFQTNTHGAELLYAIIEELAEPKPDDLVHDLYCGAGSIGLSLARRVAAVRGFEIVSSAVRDAERNALRNGIHNAEFVAGDVLQTWAADRSRAAPSLLLLDPPRAGLHKKVLQAVIEARVPRVIYVSCNPRTALPEIAALKDAAGYELTAARPVDLFPHGPHLECVFALRLLGQSPGSAADDRVDI